MRRRTLLACALAGAAMILGACGSLHTFRRQLLDVSQHQECRADRALVALNDPGQLRTRERSGL